MSSKKNKLNELEKIINKFVSSIKSNDFLSEENMMERRGQYIDNYSAITYSVRDFQDVLKNIFEVKKYSELFSRKKLSSEIISMVSKELSLNHDNSQIVNAILNKLNEKPKEFLCIIPIHGILIKDVLKCGVINLYPNFKKEELLRKNYNNSIKKLVKESINGNESFAEIKLNASESQSSLEIAKSEVEKLLDIFKCLFSEGIVTVYQIGIGKRNESMTDKTFISISIEDGKATRTYPYKYKVRPIDISQITKDGEKLLCKMFEIQRKIYEKDGAIPLDKSLMNSIRFISKGIYSDTYSNQVSKFMSAIESLVEQKTFTQGITEQVCERVSLLLCSNLKDRKELYKSMLNLYNKRSIISHGDNVNITFEDVSFLFEISRRLLFYFIFKYDEFIDSNNKPKKKLKEKVLNLKLS